MSRVEKQKKQPREEEIRYRMETYVDGNTARSVQTVPVRQVRPQTSVTTRRNRDRALQMNFSYVLFLTAAAVITVMVCINYLKLQSENTTLQKDVTSLGTQLCGLKLENDAEYNRIVSSVNLEQVKDVAMNEFGMVYAGSSQIRTYSSIDNDYVKQYQDIPAE